MCYVLVKYAKLTFLREYKIKNISFLTNQLRLACSNSQGYLPWHIEIVKYLNDFQSSNWHNHANTKINYVN